MNKPDSLSDIRRNYSLGRLEESEVPSSPFLLFNAWLSEALKSVEKDPTAMILSTATPEGAPSSRVVLLKDAGEKGFTFFTNYDSRKGRELHVNPSAALLFFWPSLERQVRIEGQVERLEESDSDAYYHSRPLENRLAAWASPQSRVIPGRKTLEDRVVHTQLRFSSQQVPRPPHWGGYVLNPFRIEFWQGRESRLHDRLLYTREGNSWKIARLAP
ncbi:MAG: pyridoxamine 5'-phosphate oxidase [Bacteroidales bacterium]